MKEIVDFLLRLFRLHLKFGARVSSTRKPLPKLSTFQTPAVFTIFITATLAFFRIEHHFLTGKTTPLLLTFIGMK